MKFQKLVSILFVFLLSITIISCSDDDEEDLVGNWIKKSEFEGIARSDAASFVIGDKGYICCGYDSKKRLSDVWEYDPSRDTWTQKADLTGVARSGAASFGTSTKGYVGTGYNGSYYLKDFWEYDPNSNSWTQIPDFEGTARYATINCSLNNIGYIGCGYDGNYLRDFWQYNPNSKQWTQLSSVGGSKRQNGTAFIIGQTIYVVGGINSGSYLNDLWAYDVSSDEWTQKRNISNTSDDSYDDKYTSIARTNASALIIDGKAYIAGGESGSLNSTVWEYTSENDLWQQKTALEGSARIGASSFNIDNRGFILCGRSSSYVFDDIWEFKPGEEENEYD